MGTVRECNMAWPISSAYRPITLWRTYMCVCTALQSQGYKNKDDWNSLCSVPGVLGALAHSLATFALTPGLLDPALNSTRLWSLTQSERYCCSCGVTEWSSFRLPACILWMCGCFCKSEIEEKETRNLIKTVQADKADSPLSLSLFISV